MSGDADVVAAALDWLARGHRATLATVVSTWGSAPRPPGSLMAIRDDGQVAGSVSGGCIEDDLIARAVRGELADRAQAVTYGANADEAARFGLPCGGTVQLVLEPLSAASRLDELAAALDARRRVSRRLDLSSGRVTLGDATGGTLHFDGEVLVTVHGPTLRLLIIGAGQLSRDLARIAVMLDYHVVVCDPRAEVADGWQSLAGVVLSRAMPDDEVQAMRPDANSAVVALTHDPRIDDLALIEALRSDAFYVGALGSRRTNDARRRRLREHFDVGDERLARLHGPVGLNLGARTPPEIALAIAAEMTACRRHAALPAGWTTPTAMSSAG